jgi:hypothetical protein
MKKGLLLVITIFLFAGCIHNSPAFDGTKRLKKEKVLIIIVENNDFSNEFIQSLYGNILTRPLILNFLSEVLAVDVKTLSKFSLNAILDKFGENKVIHNVTQSGKDYYDTIISLSDQQASFENVLKVINGFNSLEHCVDLIIDLHANNDILAFADNQIVRIDRLISGIDDIKKIRSVYQTSCYGDSMVEEWIVAGVQAVNGAAGENPFVFYSPALFLDAWIKGKTFEDAVKEARNREQALFENLIQKHLFKNAVPLILSASVLEGGEMHIAGNPALLWNK